MEFKEETGLTVKIKKLLGVGEDFFTINGEDFHSILIFYEVAEIKGKLMSKGNQDDTAEVKYAELAKLSPDNVQRIFWEVLAEFKKLAGV